MSKKSSVTGYSSYQNMVKQVGVALKELGELCEQMNLAENQKDLERSREKLACRTFSVGFLGGFKGGKSTVINSILEKEIMPTNILPCSAAVSRVTYARETYAKLRMRDGTVKNISSDELSDYVTMLTVESEKRAAEVDEVIVYCPCRFCQNGVDIVDTPGRNNNERMNQISEAALFGLDAVIMVVTPNAPFSISDAEFVCNKLMVGDLRRLIFLVNKMDLVRRAQDRERVVQGIRGRIQASVLKKIEEIYGADSREYQDAEKRISRLRVCSISALNALDGKADGDAKRIEQSGAAAFEEALTRMIMEERCALEMGAALNIIERTSLELIKAATMRKVGVGLNGDEFKERWEEALMRIRSMREKAKFEKKYLSDSAVNVRGQLEAQVNEFYPELEKRLLNVIGQMDMDLDSWGNETGQRAVDRIWSKVCLEMETAISQTSEKIWMQLSEAVREKALCLGQAINEIEIETERLQRLFCSEEAAADKTDWIRLSVYMLMDYIGFGIGFDRIGDSMLDRQREDFQAAAGYGIFGPAGNLAVWNVMLALTGANLPAVVIRHAAEKLTDKHLICKMKKMAEEKGEPEEIRRLMEESVRDMINDIRGKREWESWICSLADSQFRNLIAELEKESERMLRDTESTIDSMKKDLTENGRKKEKIGEECEHITETVGQINENLKQIAFKVKQVLESA